MTEINIEIVKRAVLSFGLILTVLFGLNLTVQAQEQQSDSLFAARLMEDNLALFHRSDSLEEVITMLHENSRVLQVQVDSLKVVLTSLENEQKNAKNQNDSLVQEHIHQSRSILALKQDILRINTELETKTQELRDKEFQLAKSEMEVKNLKNAAELNQVKLEGKLDVNSTKLEAKNQEIEYLKKSVEEKSQQLKDKTDELATYYREKDNSLRIVDSLSRALNQKELDYIRVSERLKIIEAQYNDILAKQTAATNKKKKIRFIQGVGLKNYRTPDWQLTQSPDGTSLVITNKNAGKMEFDYITGVSLSLVDLSKKDGNFTYDAGLFVGFGGQNLFKNFYIGPSFKVLDYFHVNTGINAAEYQQLQSGFKEGQQATSVPTVKEWKLNVYLGFTIDLELLASIPKK